MLKIQSLGSGSKGNCTYVASENTQILVDVGLSIRELKNRMSQAGIRPDRIDAILITHEHSDHVGGVAAFLKEFQTKIYLHSETVGVITDEIGFFAENLLETFGQSFKIGDIAVDFFSVPHDSQYCFGYTFEKDDAKISIATDLGTAAPELINRLAGSQIVMLESNHDLLKLQNNVKYPAFLKRRIAGSKGHLSNAAASLAVFQLASTGVQQIILAHLSEQNNTPTLAYNFMRNFLATKGLTEGVDISIDVAEQHRPSRLFQID